MGVLRRDKFQSRFIQPLAYRLYAALDTLVMQPHKIENINIIVWFTYVHELYY